MFQALMYAALLKKSANVVSPEGWPSVILAYRLYEWFPIFIIAILIEMGFIRVMLHISWLESLKASAAANLVSALTGILLLPLAGILWDYTLYNTFATLSGTFGHFTLSSWIGNIFYMALFLGLVEIPLIAGVTKEGINKWFVVGWIFLNILTLLMVLLTFFIEAPEIGLL